MMRYTQAEKMEIIRTIEESDIGVRPMLRELDINRSTFYEWYRRYREHGYDGLANRKSSPKKFWNRIPDIEKEQVKAIALEQPEKTPRELAWHITDKMGYFISESSVYRILKAFDLVPSPAYIVMAAADEFKHKTTHVHELWQTDFTYFKIIGWGWYYLGSVLDDFSRYIIAWKLFQAMSAEDVKELLDLAVAKTGIEHVAVRHRPRLLSDNGPCYIADELKKYLKEKGIGHTRGAPYHPMTQGKIERYHRSIKNVIRLQNYYFPGELEQEIDRFVTYYNNERYHESINNVTPADVYFGRNKRIEDRREQLKKQTLYLRRMQNQITNYNHHLITI